jgi:glycine oxidase
MVEERLELVVVGGGIIGLAVAWRARLRGMGVTVLERDGTGGATSHVAAGMLAPVTEVEFGEAGRRLLELGLRSAQMWPAFAAELEQETGLDVGLMSTGTLLLARDEDDARELERQLAFRSSLGLRVARLRPSEAREREPALAPAVRLALEAPDDHSVDPRLVLAALRRACVSAGVGIREHSRVARIEVDAGRVTGVTLASGEGLSAGDVVLAVGPWSEGIDGLPAGGAARQGPDPAAARSRRSGFAADGRAIRGRLSGAARRRSLCARRHGRGARLRAAADGGWRV